MKPKTTDSDATKAIAQKKKERQEAARALKNKHDDRFQAVRVFIEGAAERAWQCRACGAIVHGEDPSKHECKPVANAE